MKNGMLIGNTAEKSPSDTLLNPYHGKKILTHLTILVIRENIQMITKYLPAGLRLIEPAWGASSRKSKGGEKL
jgi:hypothetical protein